MLANTIFEIIGYIENPTLSKDKNKNFSYRIRKFFALLFSTITVNICTLAVIVFFQIPESATPTKLILERFSSSTLSIFFIFSTIFLMPLLTETVFRGFLYKAKKHFKLFFYISAFSFALFQVFSGYNQTNNVFLTVLLLFIGQIFIGFILGFTHIRFNFLWAYALNIFTYGISEVFLLTLLYW